MVLRPLVVLAALLSIGGGILVQERGFKPLLPESLRNQWMVAWPLFERYDLSTRSEALRYLGILDGFFRAFLELNLGKSLFLMVVMCFAPILLWLFQESNKSGRHWLLSAWMPFSVVNLGQLRGIGCVSPIVVCGTYALVKTLEPQKQGIPSPPSGTFTVVSLILHLVVLAAAALTTFWPLDSPYWSEVNLLFQVSTLVLLPLCFWPRAKPRKSEVSASVTLFKRLKLIFTLSWFPTVGWFLFSVVVRRERAIGPVIVILWDTIGVLVCFAGIVAIDVANGDAKGLNLEKVFSDFGTQGPPAAICEYFIQKETQGTKRAKVLDKTS